MRVVLLSLGAVGLPALWGWFIYRLLRKLWPETHSAEEVRHAPPDPGALVDYQI